MLHTYLTTTWHLRYPIIGAPMAYVGEDAWPARSHRPGDWA